MRIFFDFGVVTSGVSRSPLISAISVGTLPINLLMTTHEPPSTEDEVASLSTAKFRKAKLLGLISN